MERFYKTVVFVTNELKKEEELMISAKQTIKDSSKRSNKMGEQLYRQFRLFVISDGNRELYDEDFCSMVMSKKYSIRDAKVDDIKKAYRVTVYIEGQLSIIMIPFLFISDPAAYRKLRVRKLKFGKGMTNEQIGSHYDTKINDLLKLVDNLNEEKSQMYIDSDLT